MWLRHKHKVEIQWFVAYDRSHPLGNPSLQMPYFLVRSGCVACQKVLAEAILTPEKAKKFCHVGEAAVDLVMSDLEKRGGKVDGGS